MTETAGGTAAPNGGPDTVEEMPLFRLVPRRDAAAPKPQSRRERLRSFVLRIDVSWTAFFFLFLVCVAITTVSISYTRMFDSPRAVWHAVHNSRITLYRKLLDLEIENAHSIATTLMAANVRKPLPMESEKTLSVVCSTFVTLDTEVRLRAVLAVSAAQKETVVCIRGGLSNHSPRTLTGYISHNSIVEGTYYVDNVTFEYARPLEMADVWAPSVQNISGSLSASLLSREGFRQSKLFYQGLINSVDPRTLWFYFAKAPHMFYYNVPITMVARGLNLSSTDTIDDFAQVRIDGSALLPLAESFKTRSGRVILLVNSSLTSSDPFIFSNNLGERSVNDTNIYSANAAGPLSYLKVSEVRDPLMRTALKHVKLAPLQAQGYAHTVEFVYRGAPAFATAFTFTSKRGLILPVVLVSGQRAHSPPYVRVSKVYIGIIAAVVLILTALFWGFVHVSFSRPLEAMTQRMLGNLHTGHRTLFYPAGGTVCVQLSEVQQLIDAHDATVRQLRIIDGFIPAELRRHIRRSTETRGNAAAAATAAQNDNAGACPSRACAADAAEVSEEELARQLLTVVYITIHPPAPQRAANAVQDMVATVPQALSPKPYQGQRLVAAVDAAAHTVPLVNSGPFASAAAVGDFLTKVEELCEANHGSLHRFAPDSCVAHFGSFTRAHHVRKAARASPPPTAAGPAAASIPSMSDETRDVIATQACAATDARNALRFALALQQWSQEHLADPSPRVTVLVDTSTFTCGRHRPRGSEQTLSVAFGRDVQRKLGHIPLKIGVGVAMTEETATLLRAEHQRGDAVGGVRQIPVESLHVGRPGLNADVVILYEALPGAAEGDEVWQRYCWCCFRGFTLMVRGRYAAALSAFKAIADISDLEPGLMPFSLRREAARSDAVGGAVSVQVQRLMRECVKRVARGDARPFCRERCDPLGIDAVLQGVSTITELSASRTSRSAAATQSESAPRYQRPLRTAAALPLYPEAKPRHVMEYSTRGERIRTVVAGTPDWLQDNYKMCWQVAPKSPNIPAHGAWRKFQICLGAGGALAVVDVLPLREVPRPVANAIRDAPLGPMSDALRSATPVFGLTPQQKAAARAVLKQQCSLRHPNLLVPLSYCTAVEGGVAVLFEYFTGGTLRQVIRRYEHLKPVTIARFMHGVLSGLLCLHDHHLVHGSLHMDNVIVGSDSVARLHGHSVSIKMVQKLFVLPRTCYVSPAMAAGALPTAACDMFCYGLMCMELMARGKVWRWAVSDQGEPGGTDDELAALMAAAEQPFFDAVAAGRIVVNTALLDGLSPTNQTEADAHAAVRACVSYKPRQRPTPQDMLAGVESLLAQCWPDDFRWRRRSKTAKAVCGPGA